MTGARPGTLCVVGDFAWDVLIRSDAQLLRGGDTFGEVVLMPGGSGANVAVWAARCGADVHFVGKIGRDALGDLARDDLEAEGVVGHLIGSDDHATGAVAVFVDPAGERSMVSGHGADHFLVPSDLPADLLGAGGHLHITGWSLFMDPPRTAALDAVRIARAGGATISFDPSAFQLIDEMGASNFLEMTTALDVDVIFPNREEAMVLTGLSDPDEMVRRLAELYPRATVVLKLDADGSLILTGGRTERVAATVVDLVDATGAGDAYAGAFLARILSGADVVAAATTAAAVSGWVVGRVGARSTADDALRSVLAGVTP